jgi:hypothetical protein
VHPLERPRLGQHVLAREIRTGLEVINEVEVDRDLVVTDEGSPPLTRYQRVIVTTRNQAAEVAK